MTSRTCWTTGWKRLMTESRPWRITRLICNEIWRRAKMKSERWFNRDKTRRLLVRTFLYLWCVALLSSSQRSLDLSDCEFGMAPEININWNKKYMWLYYEKTLIRCLRALCFTCLCTLKILQYDIFLLVLYITRLWNKIPQWIVTLETDQSRDLCIKYENVFLCKG